MTFECLHLYEHTIIKVLTSHWYSLHGVLILINHHPMADYYLKSFEIIAIVYIALSDNMCFINDPGYLQLHRFKFLWSSQGNWNIYWRWSVTCMCTISWLISKDVANCVCNLGIFASPSTVTFLWINDGIRVEENNENTS